MNILRPPRSELWHFNMENMASTLEDEDFELPNLDSEIDYVGLIADHSGQEFSALWLNREMTQSGNRLVVAPGQYFTDVTRPQRKFEAVQLAYAFRDRPILLVDQPSHGRSSRHTMREMVNISISGDSDSEAKPMAEAINRFVNYNHILANDGVDFVAVGHGAMMAPSLARHMGNDGSRLMLVEPLGMTRRGLLEMEFGHRINDRPGRRDYVKKLKQTGKDKAYAEFADERKQRLDRTAMSPKMRLLPYLAITMSSNPYAQGKTLETIADLLEEQPTSSVEIVRGSLSSHSILSFSAHEIALIERLYGNRFSITELPDDDHNLTRPEMYPRIAAMAATKFDPEWHIKQQALWESYNPDEM